MYLVAADGSAASGGDGCSPVSCYSRWENFPVSDLSHHGQACCDSARLWLGAMDFAQLNGSALRHGPRWIRSNYDWGPSAWPLHWCEAVAAKVIDCGAHSALAHEAFLARGLETYRAQFVQSYGRRAVAQWRTRWTEQQVSDHWLADGYIYHEGNAVFVGDNEVALWDGSAGCWLNPTQCAGYGGLLAVRIWTDGEADDRRFLKWGSHRLAAGVWNALGVHERDEVANDASSTTSAMEGGRATSLLPAAQTLAELGSAQ